MEIRRRGVYESSIHRKGSSFRVNTTPVAPRQDVPADDPFAQRFQRLKADIHGQLVEMLDVSKLGHWKPERLRREVRGLAARLAQESTEMLNQVERERLIDE